MAMYTWWLMFAMTVTCNIVYFTYKHKEGVYKPGGTSERRFRSPSLIHCSTVCSVQTKHCFNYNRSTEFCCLHTKKTHCSYHTGVAYASKQGRHNGTEVEVRKMKLTPNCTLLTERDDCNRVNEDKTSSQMVKISSSSVTEATMSVCDEILSNKLTLEAIHAGNLNFVKNHPNGTLHKACVFGKLDMVKCILSQGLDDINSLGLRNKTPVMEAAMRGHLNVFDYLVDQGCDLSLEDTHRNTVLHFACKGGNVDIIKKLIDDMHFDKDRQNDMGRRPVMWAAFMGHLEAFKLLVNKGCDLRTGRNKNNNILHLACIGGNANIVHYILSQNMYNIESKGHMGRTAVMRTAAAGHNEVFRLLVDNHCNLKVVDRFKNNILHVACTGGNIDIVKYILSRKICSIESKEHKNRTPVVIAALNGHKELFEFLVKKGCRLSGVDTSKYNILHAACAGGNVGIVKYLMKLPNVKRMEKARDKHGLKPVQVAEKQGHKDVVKFLKERR